MQTNDPDSNSRGPGPQYPVVPIILTIALVSGWVVMWVLGIFQSFGPLVTGVMLLGDLLGVALIWFLWANGRLGRHS